MCVTSTLSFFSGWDLVTTAVTGTERGHSGDGWQWTNAILHPGDETIAIGLGGVRKSSVQKFS